MTDSKLSEQHHVAIPVYSFSACTEQEINVL